MIRFFKNVVLIPERHYGKHDNELEYVAGEIACLPPTVSVGFGGIGDEPVAPGCLGEFCSSAVCIDVDGSCWRSKYFGIGKKLRYNIFCDTIDLYLDDSDMKAMLDGCMASPEAESRG